MDTFNFDCGCDCNPGDIVAFYGNYGYGVGETLEEARDEAIVFILGSHELRREIADLITNLEDELQADELQDSVIDYICNNLTFQKYVGE